MTLRTKIILAFLIVYLVWGSTYLAIRVGVQQLPPVLFAGVRFDIAGVLMLIYAFATGGRLPRLWSEWRSLLITAVLMLTLANGLVTWSEVWIESNQAALIVATNALWMAWMGSLGSAGDRLSRATVASLCLGFGGVAVLVGAGIELRDAPWMAYAALLMAPVFWGAGSVYARRHPLSCAPMMTVALQMLVTGLIQTSFGLALGDAERWSWESAEAMGALVYLVVFGSCLAYGAYYWLVHQVTPAALGTYAYVNPAVAVLLGWWLLDEHLSLTQVIGTLIILVSVVLVTLASRRKA